MKKENWYARISWKSGLLIAAAFLLVDAWTKYWTVSHLPFGAAPEIELFHLLGIDGSITHAINKGAAWGAFDAFPHALIIVRLCLIAALVAYLVWRPISSSFRLPLLLIVMGAIGNVIDYFVYGHVIDMIHFRFWGYDYPVFNVADSMICVGTFAILFLSLYEPQKKS